MTNIELPGYDVIRPNEVFGRKAKSSNNLEIPFELSELLSLKIYSVPTQEDVINFIQEAAREFEASSFEKGDLSNQNSLDTYFSSFPAEEVKEIAEGQKDILDHLKEHSLGTPLERGETYLEANNILVPSQELKLFSKEESVNNVPYNWSLRFRLLEDGKLPDRLELDYLMERGVKDSDVFSVQGNFEAYEVVTNQIRMLSTALNSPHELAKIKNHTGAFLNEEASANLGMVVQCISATDVVGGLGEILQQAFENMGTENPMDPTGDYPDYGGDPSRN